jgi:hypothetical protein
MGWIVEVRRDDALCAIIIITTTTTTTTMIQSPTGLSTVRGKL